MNSPILDDGFWMIYKVYMCTWTGRRDYPICWRNLQSLPTHQSHKDLEKNSNIWLDWSLGLNSVEILGKPPSNDSIASFRKEDPGSPKNQIKPCLACGEFATADVQKGLGQIKSENDSKTDQPRKTKAYIS